MDLVEMAAVQPRTRLLRLTLWQLLGALLVGTGLHAGALAAPLTPGTPACHVGAYALPDGSVVDINATSKPGVLRWHRMDGRTGTLESQADGTWRGRTGWTLREDPLVVELGDCGAPEIRFGDAKAARILFEVTDTTFRSGDVSLRGRLVMPASTAQVPVVVLVHGSERYSGVALYHEQHLFPANGVGVFVYDKRGTGGSRGDYTQDFSMLADDALAALGEARRLGASRIGRIGFHGSSQGGWVAPLAATRAPVDFVVVAYGLAESPADEDAAQVMLDLTAAGFGADTHTLARRVTDATAEVMATKSPQSYAALRAVRGAYRHEPWWSAMTGEYTGQVVQYPVWLTRLLLPRFDAGTPWRYDPLPVLASVDVPQLWMIAARDVQAPPERTLERLATLARNGRPITTAVFPETDHGLVEFETSDDGTRTRTWYAEGAWRMALDFIRNGDIRNGQYGRGTVVSGPVTP